MNKRTIGLLGLFILLLMVSEAYAQRGRGFRQADRQAVRTFDARPVQAGSCMFLDDLSPEQQANLKELQLSKTEKSTRYRAEMDALRAKKRELMVSGQADSGQVYQVIDQMSALRSQWMKENVAHHEAIRNLLTDEQRIVFDSRTLNRPNMRQGRGFGPGSRPCRAPGGRW